MTAVVYCLPRVLNSRLLQGRCYAQVFIILLIMLLSHANAMSRSSPEKLGVATTEMPLFVPLRVARSLLEEPHYLSVAIGEIRSSGRHPPIIRLFLNTETAKLQAGSPEHLGSLTIFPWPRTSKTMVTKAAFNLSRKLSELPEAIRIIPGSSDVELTIGVAIIADQREDTTVSVDVFSIEITASDGGPL